MSNPIDTLVLSSDISNLSKVEAAVDELLEQQIISDEVYGNVLVAATEAFLNAIHHGNQDDPSKLVKVEFKISKTELILSFHDEGPGFAYDELPDPTDPENVEKVNGRGIFIIRNLADDTNFERNGATLEMHFKLNVNELVEA